MLRELLATALLVSGTYSVQGASDVAADAKADAAVRAFVPGNTAFALDLYQRLAQNDGNLFLSPYSISTALAMTYAGARGQTAEQIAKTLHFPADREELNRAYQRIEQRLRLTHKLAPTTRIANGMWAQKGYPFLTDFRDTIRTSYSGQIGELDFADSESARREINAWIAKRTNDRIKEALKQGDINAGVLLVLINTIYFKAGWQYGFGDQKQADFHLANGEAVKTTLMYRKAPFNYLNGGSFQAVELPYLLSDYSMVVFLPKKADGLAEFEKSLNSKALSGWLSRLGGSSVEVYLPQFQVTTELDLRQTLRAMGMLDAFDGSADFSGIDGRKGSFIGLARHGAFVKVDQWGTEATAETPIDIAMSKPPPGPVFRADHPFFFLIRDRSTGIILFMGRIVKP